MMKVYWWEKDGRAVRNADDIRDHKVQAERHKAEVELARLRAERGYLDEGEDFLRQEINALGRTETWGKHKRREGNIWLALFIAAFLLTVGAILWGAQIWELSPWKQCLLIFAVVLSVGGFEVFFRK